MSFSGKKILVIHNGGVGFAKLLNDICTKLGMKFDWIADKPNENAFGKIAGRLHLRFYEKVLEKHYRTSFSKLHDSYDYILIIRGEYTPHNAIRYLKEKNPHASLILYMWDSVRNNHGIESKWPLFDRVYTFDRADWQKYRNRIGFIPLFYSEEYLKHIDRNAEQQYDVAFIGTAHGDRPKIVTQIEDICRQRGMSMYKFLYCPHYLVFIYNKIFNRDYLHVKKQDLSFQTMPQQEIYSVYSRSKCILDVEIKTQTGLTMRTMDVLGLKKKLITTNKDIVNYDFYRPSNVFVIDRENIALDQDFFEAPYEELSSELYEKYSMKSWLVQLLGEEVRPCITVSVN